MNVRPDLKLQPDTDSELDGDLGRSPNWLHEVVLKERPDLSVFWPSLTVALWPQGGLIALCEHRGHRGPSAKRFGKSWQN